MTAESNLASHLYVHVPFCRSICYYCDFVHGVYRKQQADAWLDALKREIQARGLPDSLKTIYIGGGTPTSLSHEQLETLLSLLDGKDPQEYTIEVNPGTLEDETAEILVCHGISRVSLGMQSADDALLKRIGRRHTHADTVRAVNCLRAHGITNLSLDLMYSLPGQTMDMLKASAEAAHALSPKHISVYSLTVEENTVFGKKGVTPLDEDTEADMYEYLRDTLPVMGYERYETANFAVPGYESRHNLCYWDYRDFLGFSCGASGKEGLLRYDNTKNIAAYIQDPLKREEYPLSKEEAMFEAVMMNLRKRKGLELKAFEQMFGMNVQSAFGGKLERLLKDGSLRIDAGYLYCSDRGYDILNSILTELL